MERLFNLILALKERGLLPDAVMRRLVRVMCAQWVSTFECGGDTEKQAYYKKGSSGISVGHGVAG